MDIKYGPKSLYRKIPAWHNNSNKLEFEIEYFKEGAKKLIYKIQLKKNLILYFAHFSLVDKTRKEQIEEIRDRILENKK
jgi:endonuclease/exonuclease/phosphatase family metal-dependent hydrolase